MEPQSKEEGRLVKWAVKTGSMTKQQADTLVKLGFDQGNEQIAQLIRDAEPKWRGEEHVRK